MLYGRRGWTGVNTERSIWSNLEYMYYYQFSSVAQSCRTLRPHGLQHARRACSNSCPSMPSNHLILYCPLLLPSIFPSMRVFPSESVLHIRWPRYWGVSASVRPVNIQDRFPSGLTGWISLQTGFDQTCIIVGVFNPESVRG